MILSPAGPYMVLRKCSMSRNRNGSDGIIDSGTMPWNAEVLTRTMSSAPILTCSTVSFSEPSELSPNTLIVVLATGRLGQLVAHVQDRHDRRIVLGMHVGGTERARRRGRRRHGQCADHDQAGQFLELELHDTSLMKNAAFAVAAVDRTMLLPMLILYCLPAPVRYPRTRRPCLPRRHGSGRALIPSPTMLTSSPRRVLSHNPRPRRFESTLRTDAAPRA